jgi:hypothetical protein
MACEYQSRVRFQTFTDAALLKKALARLPEELRNTLQVSGLTVRTTWNAALDALKQAYQVEATKKTAKKQGFFVSEKQDENGKIQITARR